MERPDDSAELDSRLDEALDETYPASDPVAVHFPDIPELRGVSHVHAAIRDDIGSLITRRPVPRPTLDRLGAFLFLNHHGPQKYSPGNEGLPFGPHPHRGFETVTFILEGNLAHRDTAGHESVIEAGGVQWMTAGSGLVHEEISPESFKRQGGRLEILQLWVNLPARLKMTAPRYIGLQRDEIPVVSLGAGCNVNLISGAMAGKVGPIHSLTGVFMATVDLNPGARFRAEGLAGRDVFLYVARGEINVAGTAASAFNLVELDEGRAVEFEASTDAVILFGHAEPIDEPVVAHGPFVMNTEDEIRQAYADFRAGRFGTPG